VFVCVFLLCRKCYPLMKVLCDKETNIVKYHTARLVTFLLYYRYIRRRRTATKTKKVSDIVIICECGGNRLVSYCMRGGSASSQAKKLPLLSMPNELEASSHRFQNLDERSPVSHGR
jgi:hypothetical protein